MKPPVRKWGQRPISELIEFSGFRPGFHRGDAPESGMTKNGIL